MVRFVAAIAVVAVLAACGDSGGTAPSPMGTARYIRDANTCNGPGNVSFDFFLDGAQLGSQSLAAGQGASFAVIAGSHAFSGRITNTTLSFATVNGTVPTGGTFSYTMLC